MMGQPGQEECGLGIRKQCCINGESLQFGHCTARGVTIGLGLRSLRGAGGEGSLPATDAPRFSRSKQVDKAERREREGGHMIPIGESASSLYYFCNFSVHWTFFSK